MAHHRIVELLGGEEVLGGAALADLDAGVRAGLPYAAFEAVQASLQVTAGELAEVIRLPMRTQVRRRQQRKLTLEESDRLSRVARVWARAIDVLGSGAPEWMRRPNRALGLRVPLQLLATDVGAGQVDAVLGRIEHGVYS